MWNSYAFHKAPVLTTSAPFPLRDAFQTHLLGPPKPCHFLWPCPERRRLGMSVYSFIFLQPGGSLRADVVYSLPGAHNCPTIWAGAKSFPKGKAGTRLSPLMWGSIKALERRKPQSQDSPRRIGVGETPCQGRGVRVNLLRTQTMVWKGGGAIWRDGEARRIVAGLSRREIRARAGIHLSHSEPVLVCPSQAPKDSVA